MKKIVTTWLAALFIIAGMLSCTVTENITKAAKKSATAAVENVTELSAIAGDGSVALFWKEGKNVPTKYIQWSDATGEYSDVDYVAPGVKMYLVEGLTNGVEYMFKIKTMDSAGKTSANEVHAFATPMGDESAPENVKEVSVVPGDKQVTLSWKDPSSLTEVHVYHSPFSANGQQPKVVTKGVQTVTISGLENKTEYTFTIQAVNGQHKATGLTVKATPDTFSVAAVINPKAVAGDKKVIGQIQLGLIQLKLRVHLMISKKNQLVVL